MTRLTRFLAFVTISSAAVALGTFGHEILSLGVAVPAILVGIYWHQNDCRTQCGFAAMVAGLASIWVCAKFS